jgi:hypothetical protein
LNVTGSPLFYIENVSPTGGIDPIPGLLLLYLGNISLPEDAVYTLTIAHVDSEYERTVLFNKSRASGCAVSVPAAGNYTVRFESWPPGVAGILQHDGGVKFSADDRGDTVYKDVRYSLDPPGTPSTTPLPTASARPSQELARTDVFEASSVLVASQDGPPVSSPMVESVRLTDTGRFDSSATLTSTPEAASSGGFAESAAFEPSSADENTAVFAETATPTPAMTVESDHSLSESFVDSLTVTESESAVVVWTSEFSPVALGFTTTVVLANGEDSVTLTQSLTVVLTYVQRISYSQVVITVVTRSPVWIQIAIHTITPIITERPNALIIGLATAGGLIVAILAGVGLYLYRVIVNPEEAEYLGPRRRRKWLLARRDDEPEVEDVEDPFKTQDFSNVQTGNYETMADYADLTIEADEIFI